MNTICTVLLLLSAVLLGVFFGFILIWFMETLNKTDKGEK